MSRDTDDLEARLGALKPAPPSLNRDATLIRMGRASAPGVGRWRAASAALVVIAVGFALAWWHERSRPPVEIVRVVERIVEVQVPVAPPTPTPTPTPSPGEPFTDTWSTPLDERNLPPYLRLQQQILRHGLDGLTTMPAPSPARPTPTLTELLNDLENPQGDL